MKGNRQEKILELIEQYDIETQTQLAEHLQAAGYDVTQATVSRDIRKLKLSKVSTTGGKQKYVGAKQEDSKLGEKYICVLKDGFISMASAQNILVIKTVPGMAMAVAAAIDAMHMNQIVGSIAGDDTIMAAIRTTEETPGVMEHIRKILK